MIIIINSILKIIIARNRPNVLQLVHETTYSYPSGHTISIAALIFMIVFLFEKSKKYYIIIFLIAFSRIYLGVHYLSDIIGALLLASIIVELVGRMYERKNN